jgi:hypothetical protein
MGPETFWSLLRDRAHWEFELFVNLVFDGLVCGVVFPFAKKHIVHHLQRDEREGIN